MKSSLLTILTVLFMSGASFAQIKVSGTVKDAADQTPLPGVNVVLKGVPKGTSTNANGKFEIAVPDNNSVIQFSFIGYKTKEVKVGTSRTINVELESASTQLNEVVAVGYGTAKKSDLSGATVSVSSEKMKSSISSGFDQSLQGRAAGVSTVQTSGQPGSSTSIRIRGTSTLNSDAEPLYVIDGVPISSSLGSVYDVGLASAGGGGKTSFSALSSINPNDIVSMEILKDASATAIYGSRGANGVVLITTKRGKAEQTRISYEGMYGIQDQATRLDLMNLREFADYSNQRALETGRKPNAAFADPSLLGEGTDWQDAIFRTAYIKSHNITISGGSNAAKFAISGGYYNQEGTVLGSQFERYSFRTNLDADLYKWLKVGNSLSLSRTVDHVGLYDQTGGIIQTAATQTPDVPVKTFDGQYGTPTGEGAITRVNPIAMALDKENKLLRNRILGNVFAEATLYKGLTFRSEFGGDFGLSNAYTFNPTYQYGTQINTQNTASKQYNQNTFWQFKNYLTYNFNLLEKHNINAMVGQEASEWSYENLNGTSSGLPTNEIHEPSLGDITSMKVGSGRGSGAMESFYTRLNYNYSSKYFLTFTYRADGSSNFGPNNRWAYFPSVAGSWRISSEPFMASLNNVITNLKLRAGWGQTGNQNIGGYKWGSALSKVTTNLGSGYRVQNYANDNIKWETSIQSNLGIDIGLLNNRIEITVDAYLKKSKDMLMQMQLPSYMGTSGNAAFKMNAPYGNFGEIENKGIEISVSTTNIKFPFEWKTDFQITFNRNKLVSLGTENAMLYGYAQWNDLVSVTKAGQQIGEFYGYKVIGVYKDANDIINSPKPKAYPTTFDSNGNPVFKREQTVFPGDLKFADISGPNGKPDGVINEYDRTNLGSPQPKFSFGMTNTFNYKNFELSIFIMGQYGNKLFNYFGRNLSGLSDLWTNELQLVTNRAKLSAIDANKTYTGADGISNWWDDAYNVKVSNPNTNVPRATSSDPNENKRMSDRYIEDGSFLRIKNISLGYILPNKWTKKVGLENIKVYANIQNLYTFTNYSGYDPEIGEDTLNPFVSGLDNGRYPSPRIVSFGLNITL